MYKGYKHSEEAKRKMSETRIKKNLTAWNKGKKGLVVGWNKGLKISGMSGKKQSEYQKMVVRKRNLEDNPSKRPEVRLKMRLAKLGKPGVGIKLGSKRENISGKNHWGYITDRTKLKREDKRNDPLYKEWRRQVCNRESWKCKINNKDCKGRLEVHHILGFTEYPELRYEINNGISLCHFHHPRKKIDEKKLIPILKKLVEAIV